MSLRCSINLVSELWISYNMRYLQVYLATIVDYEITDMRECAGFPVKYSMYSLNYSCTII